MALALPATPSVRDGNWRLISNAARFVSPLTKASQGVARKGDLWAANVALPPLTKAQAKQWSALMAQLAGWRANVLVPPPIEMDAIAGLGTALVKGANQAGTSLLIDGPATGALIPAGTWFSFDVGAQRALHLVVADATMPGAGEVTLSIAPAVRASPADNAPLDFVTPHCEMRLENPNADVLDLSAAVSWGLTLSLIEYDAS